MARFEGKVLIVTGGASGIGEATALEFAAGGGAVAVADINQSLGEKVVSQIRSDGGEAMFVNCDVADYQSATDAVAAVTQSFGSVNYLVNSAASFLAKGLDADKETWDKCLGVNVVGGFNMVKACTPAMREAGGGSIVNLSSTSAHIAQSNRWTYSSSKGAILTITRCMAMDLACYKIRVNSVSPAWIWTPIVAEMAGGDIEKYDRIWGKFHMLKRCGQSAEVAKPILFLLSDDASFITATDLHVDGGFLGISPEGMDQSELWPDES